MARVRLILQPAAMFAGVPGIGWGETLGNWLFAGLGNLRLQPIEVHPSPNATHVVYSTRDVGYTP